MDQIQNILNEDQEGMSNQAGTFRKNNSFLRNRASLIFTQQNNPFIKEEISKDHLVINENSNLH